MTPFAVAGLQLDLSANDDNLSRIASRIGYTCSHFPFVQMIVLSELAAFGPSTANAQPMPGPAEEMLAQTAAKHGIWLVTGSMFERMGDKIYNTSSVIAPSG